MFSKTTIASSITTPTAKVSASMVELLMVYPMTRMRAKVATMEVGMAMLAMTVLRQSCMNAKTVKATSTMPSTRWKEISPKLRRIKRD